MIRPACLLILHAAIASALTAATAQGIWTGTYAYPEDAQPPVTFTMAVKEMAPEGMTTAMAVGRCVELNTFGEASAPTLTSAVTMRIHPEGTVELVKTYDGSGGQTHTVWYSGTYVPEKDAITGEWYIADQWKGTFTLRRVAQR